MKIEQIGLQSFNSTLVQLKVVTLDNVRAIVPEFQFYLSSIKRQTKEILTAISISFNSTLVQLKELKIRVTGNCSKCFNSTLVQLKDANRDALNKVQSSFNSTLVQLKANSFLILFESYFKFQFYLSSIKSRYFSDNICWL